MLFFDDEDRNIEAVRYLLLSSSFTVKGNLREYTGAIPFSSIIIYVLLDIFTE